MKPKGIWIAIFLILAIGTAATSYVNKRTGDMEDDAGKEIEMSFARMELSLETAERAAEEDWETAKSLPGDEALLRREEAEDETKGDRSFENQDGQESRKIRTGEPENTGRKDTGRDTVKEEPSQREALGESVLKEAGIQENTEDLNHAFSVATAAQSPMQENNLGRPEEENLMPLSEEAPAAGTAVRENGPGGIRQEDVKFQNAILARLEELDSLIARNRARETDMTANSQKAAAENEWKLWEAEMQRIIENMKEALDPGQTDSLMRQQREWIRDRESQAVASSKKQMGSSMEEVSYNRALAELTRERVYELAEVYGGLLP